MGVAFSQFVWGFMLAVIGTACLIKLAMMFPIPAVLITLAIIVICNEIRRRV